MVRMLFMPAKLWAKMNFFAHFAQLSRLFITFPLLIKTFITFQLLHFISSAIAVQDHNQTQSLIRAYHQPNLSGIEHLAYHKSDFNQRESSTETFSPIAVNKRVKRSVHRGHHEGPRFTKSFGTLGDESTNVNYYNSSGLVLRCSASGKPSPTIEWYHGSDSEYPKAGSPASDINGLRYTREDGSLILLPFSSDQYQQDVHSTAYWCKATNDIGSIISPPIQLKGVWKANFQILSEDGIAMTGNAGTLSCNVPNSVKQMVSVVKWQRNDGLSIENSASISSIDNQVRLLDDGSLFFEEVTLQEARWKYRCAVRDELNGEIISAKNWAKFIITEAKIKSSPRIITPYKEYTVKAGHDVQIACIAQANPPPVYHWIQESTQESLIQVNRDHKMPHKSDGSKKVRSLRPLLRIQNIQSNHGGLYSCVVNNSMSEERRRFKIDVKETFVVKIKPEGLVSAREGSSVSLDCLLGVGINGNIVDVEDIKLDKLSIIWLKDSQTIMFSSRIKLMRKNRLKILDIGREDQGMYQCVVNTVSGETYYATDSIQLNLREEAPILTEKFYSQTLHPSSSASLKCIATGSPVPTIRWYFYGNLINFSSYHNSKRTNSYQDGNGATISFLNISTIELDDGGYYTCEAINDVASVSHSSNLHVFGPPIVHQMDNLTVASSSTIDIHCQYSGYPVDRILWAKDGKNLLATRGIKVHANGTLSIMDAHSEHEGWYRCEVSNQDGRTASGSLYVNVLEKPSINPFIFGSDLREGMRAAVLCSIGSGEPPFRITWYKEDTPLDQTNLNVQIESLGDYTSSLKINNIRRAHTGNYTCRVSSTQASHIYSTYTSNLIVQAAPKWILKPFERYSSLRGNKIMMDCQAEGIPPPVYQWKRARRSDSTLTNELIGIVSGPHMHVLENGTMVIIDVTKSDEGDYVCEVNNNRGPPLTSVSRLQVHDPVHFKKNFDVVKVKSGVKVELPCEPCGDQPIDIVWHKDPDMDSSFLKMAKYNLHQDIRGNCVHSRVSLISSTVDDSGFFICSASNPYGSGEKSIQLIVQGVPRQPKSLKTVDIASREITLTWDTPNDGNSPLLDYLIQYTRNNASWNYDFDSLTVPAKDASVTISGLSSLTSYKFRVIAQNALGYSDPSDELTVTTLEEAPIGIASHISVQPLSTHSLKILWKSPVLMSIPQRIDGYYVGFREITDYRTSSSSIPSSTNTFSYKKIETGLAVQEQSSLSSPPSNEMSMVLSDLKRNTRYGLVIKAYNRQGTGPASKEVLGQTLEYDPPTPVKPRVVDIGSSSLRLAWQTDNLNPVEGFIINYRTDSDEWIDRTAMGTLDGFTLTGLRCGTRYQITVTAFNKVGRSEPSEPLVVSTAGSAPSAPSLDSLVTTNWSSISIQLRSWIENGCPILSFMIQYKLHEQVNWITLSNNVIPEQRQVSITDLQPAQWYDLSMTAHSEAGSTEAQYQFATLTVDGGTIPPPSAVTDNTWQSIINDPIVVIPVFAVLLITIIITVIILYASYKGCSSEPVITSQRSFMSQDAYFPDSGGKCENLNMSSFSTKLSAVPDGFESHYGSCRMEPKYLLTSSINCDASGLICSDGGRVCSDHVYDMPLRPEAHMAIGGEGSVGARKQLILL